MSNTSNATRFTNAAKARETILKNIKTNVTHINSGGLNFALIDDTFANYVDYLESFDGIIIQYTKWSSTLQFLKNLRTHQSTNLMLKPTFLYNLTGSTIIPHQWTVDGLVADLDLLTDVIHKTKRIQDRQDWSEFPPVKEYHFNIHKTILFAKTREISTLEPFMSRYSKLGYQYPFLSYFYDYTDKATSLSALSQGEQREWLLSEYMDSVYVCNNCDDGFLVYREVCPHCYSSDLKEEEIIHHFRCAHVGPASQFFKNEDNKGELSCPKCYKELQHVGVDYDRPSVITHCNQCHKDFQNVTIMTRCSSCSQEIPVEHLFKKEINTYKILSKGFTEALQDLVNYSPVSVITKSRTSIPGIVSKKALHEHLLDLPQEQHRKDRLVVIRLRHAESIIAVIGEGRKDQVDLEIVQSIRSIFGQTCLMAYKNKTFYSLVSNRSKSEVSRLVAKADLLVTALLNDNLKLSQANYLTHKSFSVQEYLQEWQDVLDLMNDD